jgi:hypothetical protein
MQTKKKTFSSVEINVCIVLRHFSEPGSIRLRSTRLGSKSKSLITNTQRDVQMLPVGIKSADKLHGLPKPNYHSLRICNITSSSLRVNALL